MHLCAKFYKSAFQKYHLGLNQASFKAITTSLRVIAGPYVSGQITLYYGITDHQYIVGAYVCIILD